MSYKIDWTTLTIPSALKYGTSDYTISSSGGYNGITYTGLTSFKTNNSEFFATSSYGITVKKAGWYLIAGYINLDLTNNAVQWIMQGNGILVTTVDHGSQTGMGGVTFPMQVTQLSANTNVYPILAFANSASILTRGSRSYISIVKIG